MKQTSWASREGLLLRAIIDRLDAEGPGVDPQRVADAIRMSHEDANRASRRLHDAGMLRAMTGDDRVISVREVTEKGLQAAGEWPSDAELLTDRIMEVLAERAENEPEPEKRSRLAAARGVGRDVFVDVVGTALARLMPGG